MLAKMNKLYYGDRWDFQSCWKVLESILESKTLGKGITYPHILEQWVKKTIHGMVVFWWDCRHDMPSMHYFSLNIQIAYFLIFIDYMVNLYLKCRERGPGTIA